MCYCGGLGGCGETIVCSLYNIQPEGTTGKGHLAGLCAIVGDWVGGETIVCFLYSIRHKGPGKEHLLRYVGGTKKYILFCSK